MKHTICDIPGSLRRAIYERGMVLSVTSNGYYLIQNYPVAFKNIQILGAFSGFKSLIIDLENIKVVKDNKIIGLV